MSHPAADQGKKKALELAISQIQKQFGDGAIMALGKHSAVNGLSVIKTGAISLDIALGLGGVPRGRIIEIYGPESSGKSTLATHIVANAQKAGGLAAYIDAEHALDPSYAAKIGVNIDELMISQPDNGEEALNIGLQARMMSQALRKLTATLARSNTCAIFINQIREKIGVMFGNPETTTGGRALKFYASIRMDIRRLSGIKNSDNTNDIGSRVRVKVVKNKCAPPFQNAEFDIMFNEGISHIGSLIDVGVDTGVIEKKGTWFSFQSQRLGQGREAAREEMKNNPKLTEDIEKGILAKLAAGGSLQKKPAAREESAV